MADPLLLRVSELPGVLREGLPCEYSDAEWTVLHVGADVSLVRSRDRGRAVELVYALPEQVVLDLRLPAVRDAVLRWMGERVGVDTFDVPRFAKITGGPAAGAWALENHRIDHDDGFSPHAIPSREVWMLALACCARAVGAKR